MIQKAAHPPSPASVWTLRARSVYEQVRSLIGAARRDALDRACGEDWTLHAEVAALLAHDANPSPSTTGGRGAVAGHGGPLLPSDLEPDAIPGFRIGRLLGFGGAGAVYAAEQASPRRTVALKIFRSPGTDERLRQRIAHEAEVLARLQHPCVAQVYAVHAGAGVGGSLPWIAMELVQGTPIDDWCRERGTSLRERVALLATVAEGVAHAHASGVVHRDLKPANVLVTEEGAAKVVDFGVARTLGEAPAVGTLHTRDGDLVGTVAYMSVEQAEGVASFVDARTDVHALGVLGFELLAGRLPRDPSWKSLPEWAEALRRPAPSLREVVDGIPTDLALVIGKALEPDREGRYATAQAFADDLRRFLRAEPIVARAPTRGYLVRSFARRHRALVGGVLATLLALVGGIVVSLRFALESDAQRRRADRESHEARREAYRAQVGVASQAIAGGDAFGARAALGRASPELRGWEWRRLDAQVDRSARIVPFAERLERWRAVAARAPLVVGGTAGGGAVVLDADTGRVKRRLRAVPAIERAVFLGDGSRIVVARSDGALEVVELATGDARALPGSEGRAGECDALAASPDGTVVVESRVALNPRVRIVDLGTGALRLRKASDAWTWTSLVVGPEGRSAVCSSANGRVEILDTTSDAPMRTVADHDNAAIHVVLDASGRRAFSGGADRRALLFDLDGGGRPLAHVHQQGVVATAWSEDGARVATWSHERVIRVFDPDDLRLLVAIPAPDLGLDSLLRLREGGTEVEAFDLTARRVWFVDHDGGFDVLRGHRSQAEGNRYPFLYDVAFSPDGRRLATAGWDGSVRVFGAATLAPLAVLETAGAVQAFAWSPDGEAIVAVGRPGDVTRFDARTGRRTAVVTDGVDRMEAGIAFTPDGASILTPVGGPNGLVLRDAVTLERRPGTFLDGYVSYSLAVGRTGTLLVGNGDGRWDRRTLDPSSPPLALPPHTQGVARVAMTHDEALFASAGKDGLARLVDARTGLERAVLRGHVGRVYAVAFTPDGRRLATGGDDGTIRVHDASTGEELLVLRGHTAYVHGLHFSPDGTTLASASGDNTARLWSTTPLRERVARRDRALAIEAAVDPLVRETIARAPTPEAAVEALRTREGLGDDRRAAALDVALRLLSPVVSAPRAK